MKFTQLGIWSFFFLSMGTEPVIHAPQEFMLREGIVVAWNDPSPGKGYVRMLSLAEPFPWKTDALLTGADAVLHQHRDRLFVLSPAQENVTIIDTARWRVTKTIPLPPGSAPRDIVVYDSQAAYVSCANSAHLLRVNLNTGAIFPGVNLGIFNPPGVLPDMNRMILYKNRLFIQIRNLQSSDDAAVNPSGIAVVDLDLEQIIDADPTLPGINPILLCGTAPKFRMSLVEGLRPQLFVSSTGQSFDDGGIERIDVESLTTAGLVIEEDWSLTGADLGAFVLLDENRGYLSFTTDLLLSSHLHEFSTMGEVNIDEMQVALNYFAPVIEYEPVKGRIFFPMPNGVHVFDAKTHHRLTHDPIATDGEVSDLLRLKSN